nr:hypothetical protein [Tanacetum cinerariifolium]
MDEALIPHAQRFRIGRSNFRLLSDIKSKELTMQLVYDVLRICPFFKAFLVKHKNHKKSNEMYYHRFTKVLIHHFMSKGPSIPRRNKVNWHYVRDDNMFSTIRLVSRHQHIQLFGALLPIELTNEEIMNSNAYKEYYAIAIRVAPPKPKASVRRTRSSSDASITPLTIAASPRLTAFAKGKQIAKASKAKSLSALSENSTEDEGDDGGKDGDGDDDDNGDDGKEGDEEGGDDEQEYDDDAYAEETKDEESFDPIPKTPEYSKDEGNGEEDIGLNVGGEDGHNDEEEEDKLYRNVNINQGRGIQATLDVEDSHVTLTQVNPDGQQQSSSMPSQFVTSMLHLTLDVGMESIFETTSQMDVHTLISVAPLPMTEPIMTLFTVATLTTTSQAPILPTTVLRSLIQNLLNFGSLFGFDNRLRTLEANFSEVMQTNQFARAVSAIPGITSHAVVVDLLAMDLKKILIEKMEGNKSIQRSDEQRNLYKALVEAYESDKIILDTYGETVTLKRRHDDDADKDEEPFAGPDRGSKRRREGKEPELASAPTKTATRSAGRNIEEEREDELYRDVNINQGRGLQASLEVEDSYVTLTPVHPDGQQESSSVSSQFVTSMLNPTLDVGMESIFETTSRMDVQTRTSVAPLPITTPTMTSSTIATTTTTSQAPILPTTSDRLRDEAQRENDEFLRTVDENIKKIIKEQVKEQVKVQVSKILLRIKQTVNEQLEAEVLTRLSHSSRTFYAVAADLSEMELKKILIEKMEGNKSIQRSDEQRNLYKALIDAYKSDKLILDTYGDTVTLKRRRDDDADKDEEPSAGPDQGSKRGKERKDPESTSVLTKTTTRSASRSSQGSRSRQSSNITWKKSTKPQQINWTESIPKTKAADYGHIKWIKDLVPRTMWITEPIGYVKHALWGVSHWGRKRQQFYGFAINRESARDVYSKRRIIAVTELKFVEWNSYKHLDWITVRRDDDKLYMFKEGNFKRLLEECFAFNVSLRMFTRSIVIQRRVEDLQLGVESYHKKLNLTKPDSYRSNLKRNEAYTAYSNPRGFIYQNKDKKNRLMWIDELHKFSDETLTDVRTALDNRLKGIRMRYLPQTIWRKSDKDRAAAMIQAIDKRLKTRRIMRSLERFVGGRLYEGDFKMLQRTI